jgi:hypothetical protein
MPLHHQWQLSWNIHLLTCNPCQRVISKLGVLLSTTQASSYLTSESLDMYFIYLVLKLPSRFLAVSSLKLKFLPHNLNLSIEHVGSSNVSRTHGNFL